MITYRPTKYTSCGIIINELARESAYGLLTSLQCESKKSPTLRTCGNFSKTVGNFSTKFYTPITCSYLR